MTNRIINDMINHLPLPEDADSHAILLDLIDTATREIASAMTYARDRFDMISDYDDYIPADANILAATTAIFFSHEHDTPRDALLALISDVDFLLNLTTSDSDYLLTSIIDPDY